MDIDDLSDAIKKREVILFVGAGVSAALGLPTWHGLIEHMAKELGYDPELFQTTAGGYLSLAQYYRNKRDSIGPLRSWMETHWSVDHDKLKTSKVHNSIVDLNCPIIYTTNFDRILEKSFEIAGRTFKKIANARDIRMAGVEETQIVKFHGDFDDDEFIVLTETDYYKRLSFEHPLDLKLRADAIGRSILFIGYSLSDINIRLLLFKLSQMWKSSGFDKYQPSSYLFQSAPDPIQATVLGEWGVRVMTEDVDNPDFALSDFLKRLL